MDLRRLIVDGGLAVTHDERYQRVLVRWLIRHFDIMPGSHILDLGCGEGYCVYEFARAGMDACGIDHDAAMIYGRSRLVMADVRKPIPIMLGQSHIVISKSVIEHIGDGNSMLTESWKALLVGGGMIVLTPDWRYCYRGFYADIEHIRPYTVQSLGQLMRKYFRMVREETIRPQSTWLKYPALRPLIAVITAIVPYRWLGGLRFAHRRHTMALVSGVK